MDPEALVEAILRDRNGTGIRSNYPRYYVWENNRLWLIGNLSLLPLPAGDSSISFINSRVAEILKEKKIQFRTQNIYQVNGGENNLSMCKSGNIHEVLEAIYNSVELEVAFGRRRRSDLRKLLHRKSIK